LLIIAVKGCHTEIGERLTETTNYTNIAALAPAVVVSIQQQWYVHVHPNKQDKTKHQLPEV